KTAKDLSERCHPEPRRRQRITRRGSRPVVHLRQKLIDRQQPLGAVRITAKDRVIPTLHADGPIEVVADAQSSAGNELEKDLLVRRSCQAAIGKRNRVVLSTAVAPAAFFGKRRRKERY